MDKHVRQFGLADPESTVVLGTSLQEEKDDDGKREC
jgi:hypothetical protein